MKKLCPVAATQDWLHRPLCRRYAAVVFSVLSKLSVSAEPDVHRTIWWAFGMLINGNSEILGIWNSRAESTAPLTAFDDLNCRGVEFIRYSLGNLAGVETALKSTFRGAEILPSIEQSCAFALAGVRPRHRAATSSFLRAAVGGLEESSTTVSPPGISSTDCRKRYPKLSQQLDEAVALFRQRSALPGPYRRLVDSADRTAIEVHERLMRAINRHGPFADSAEVFDYVVGALLRAEHRLHRDGRAARMAREVVGSCLGHQAQVSGSALGLPASA